MQRFVRSLICAAGLIAACPAADLPAAPPAGASRAKRVLVIGIDGTRPDALLRADTPNLDELIRHGSFTDTAQVLGTRYEKNDTISGPGWSSLLTGVWADKHGIQDNGFKGARFEAFPHFFKRLEDGRTEARTISLVSWKPIHEFILPEADVRRTEPLPQGAANPTFDLKVSADKLKIDTRNGRWHHLLARRAGDKVTLYLDGQLAAEKTGAGELFDLGGAFYFLGRDTRTGETRFRGQLDDIRLWTRPLSDEEIQDAAAHSATSPATARREGLLAEYRFNAGGPESEVKPSSDKTASDSAGHPSGPFHAVSATDGGSLRYLEETDGKRSFDLSDGEGDSHGARVPLSAPLRSISQGDFTVEARFQTTNAGRNVLIGNFSGSAGALNLELHEKNTIRVWIQPPGSSESALKREEERDRRMAETAANLLTNDDPDAMFVYFHQVDATGHTIGFSPEVEGYVRAIENVDRHIGTVLAGLRSRKTYGDEDWLTIVCTDHGGFKTGHGGGHKIPEIRNVFLIVSGPSAKVGRLDGRVFLVDVAGTALTHLLGRIDPK